MVLEISQSLRKIMIRYQTAFSPKSPDGNFPPRRRMGCLGRDQKMEKRHASRQELFVVGAIFQ
jgi:hypothetical protein